jgi:hypothetical protein
VVRKAALLVDRAHRPSSARGGFPAWRISAWRR